MRNQSVMAALTAAGIMGVTFGLVPSASAAPEPVVDVLAGASWNAMFHLSPHYFPELAQSFTVTQPTSVNTVALAFPGYTEVQPQWWTTPELQRHGFERSVFDGEAGVDAVTFTLWRAPTTGDLGPAFDLRNGFQKVTEVTRPGAIPVGNAYLPLTLPAPVTLTPGTYVGAIRMDVSSPSIVTVYVAGVESGNNTNTGLLHNLPPNGCEYTRTADPNPGARVYRSDPGYDVPLAPDVYAGTAPTFTEHAAKVNECIQVGRYGDIWNPGDIAFRMTLAAPESPEGVIAVPGRGVVSIRWDQPSAGDTATIYKGTATVNGKRVGACTAAPAQRSCTIKGLKRGTPVRITVSSVNANGVQLDSRKVAVTPK